MSRKPCSAARKPGPSSPANVAAGSTAPQSGNVITGAGTASGPAGADTPGADGAIITGIRGASATEFSPTSTPVNGQYGRLVIAADGTYAYIRSAGTPGGVSDVFTYRLTDADGDVSTATLTIRIGDSAPSLTVPQAGDDGTLVDEAGLPVTRPGTMGEIVGTAFDNQVMPFIRYRTGDMAILGDRPHPLLPGHPVVDRIEGRRQEFLVCSDGRLIAINSLTTPKYDDLEQVEDVQFEQHRPGHFLVKVVSAPPLSATARRRIVQAMEDKTQGGCTAELVQVDGIARTARGKQRMMLQHLDLGRYFAGLRQ